MRPLLALFLIGCTSVNPSAQTHALTTAQQHYQSGQPVTILFVGDSIAMGATSENGVENDETGGFRLPLWQAAQGLGVDLHFLGRLSDGPPWMVQAGESRHDGYSGYLCGTAYDPSTISIRALAANLCADAIAQNGGAAPDIIDLNCGENDITHRVAVEVPPGSTTQSPPPNTQWITLPFYYVPDGGSGPQLTVTKNGVPLTINVDYTEQGAPDPSNMILLSAPTADGDVLVISEGSTQVVDRMVSVVDELRANCGPDVQIMVNTVAPIQRGEPYTFMQWYAFNVRYDLPSAIAGRSGVWFVDTSDYIGQLMSDDGSHPSIEGYEIGSGTNDPDHVLSLERVVFNSILGIN